MSDDDIRTLLEASLGLVLYSDLAAHLARNAVFVVAPGIDLMTCALAIARDDCTVVEGWIERADLRRPSPQELESWPTEEGRSWLSVVVKPFVLIRDPG